MAWAEPSFSRKEVDRAAALLASGKPLAAGEVNDAVAVVGNWRAAHAFPLNTFQMGLRRTAQKVLPGALIAQRLKRLPTMLDKLRRMPRTTLTRFQDIGGCRAVLTSLRQVLQVRASYRRSRMKHKLVRERETTFLRPERRGTDAFISSIDMSAATGVHTMDSKSKYNCGLACSTRGQRRSKPSERCSISL